MILKMQVIDDENDVLHSLDAFRDLFFDSNHRKI